MATVDVPDEVIPGLQVIAGYLRADFETMTGRANSVRGILSGASRELGELERALVWLEAEFLPEKPLKSDPGPDDTEGET